MLFAVLVAPRRSCPHKLRGSAGHFAFNLYPCLAVGPTARFFSLLSARYIKPIRAKVTRKVPESPNTSIIGIVSIYTNGIP